MERDAEKSSKRLIEKNLKKIFVKLYFLKMLSFKIVILIFK